MFLAKNKDVCQKCGKIHNKEEMYVNKKDGTKWCFFCLGVEKRRREKEQRNKFFNERLRKKRKKDKKD
jgi:hypothetical protein